MNSTPLLAEMPITDTHFHIVDKQFSRPWMKAFQGELKSCYTLEDYLAAIANLNIVKSCFVETDVIPAQHKDEADMAIALCQDPSNQVVAATIGCNMAHAEFSDYIQQYAKEPRVKSVRHNFFAADPAITQQKLFINNARLTGELEIMIDLVMAAEKIFHGVNLVKACPNTTFVIDHCGLCPIHADNVLRNTWQEGILAYAEQPNTICKISEVGFLTVNEPWQIADVVDIIRHCVKAFGEDRIIYASNWPVCEMTATVGQWIEAIKHSLSEYPQTFFDKLFYQNAERYYLS